VRCLLEGLRLPAGWLGDRGCQHTAATAAHFPLSPSLRALPDAVPPTPGKQSFQGNNYIVVHSLTKFLSHKELFRSLKHCAKTFQTVLSISIFFFLLVTTAALTEHKFLLPPTFTPPQSSLFCLSLETLLFPLNPIPSQLQLNMQRALSSAARARPAFSNMRPFALTSSPLSSRQPSRAYSHKVSALTIV